MKSPLVFRSNGTFAFIYRTFSCIIMLLLLASTCVVMLNIFIAQLSNRYQSETEKVDLRFETLRAATIANYERGEDLTSFNFFCHCCSCCKVSIYCDVHCVIYFVSMAHPPSPFSLLYFWHNVKHIFMRPRISKS